MTRDDVLTVLRAHKATLWERFGVTGLHLFGSSAHDEASDTSDVDVLVRFDRAIHWERNFGAQFYLEDLLVRPADLVTEKNLWPEVPPFVEREVVDV